MRPEKNLLMSYCSKKIMNKKDYIDPEQQQLSFLFFDSKFLNRNYKARRTQDALCQALKDGNCQPSKLTHK